MVSVNRSELHGFRLFGEITAVGSAEHMGLPRGLDLEVPEGIEIDLSEKLMLLDGLSELLS